MLYTIHNVDDDDDDDNNKQSWLKSRYTDNNNENYSRMMLADVDDISSNMNNEFSLYEYTYMFICVW